MTLLRSAALATGVTYLGYRIAFTSTGAHPVMFFLLLAAEVFGMLRLAMELSVIGEVRPASRTPESSVGPDADVVVVVTDEPASEVRAAILSAKVVRGFGKLVVVDRDDRHDVATLCSRFKLDRVVGGFGADLGALVDEAFGRCDAPLALLVPADVVVMPDVLEVTAGAFVDPRVGVVVSRIDQANATNLVDFGGYGEDRIRDELMISRLDGEEEALPWWPGMSVVRRAAIEDVGGMARGRQNVTLSTGFRLQEREWKITDVPVVVARRLAPWSDDRHLHRWARDLHERLSVLVEFEAPARAEDESGLRHRVYRLADMHVGHSIQRLVLIGVLFVTIFSSWLPLTADPLVLVSLWGAWQASSFLLRVRAYEHVGFVPWMANDLRMLCTNLVVARRALRGRPLESELVEPAPGRRARAVLLNGLQVGLGVTLAAVGLGIVRTAHGDFVTLACLGLCLWLWAMVLQARSGPTRRQVRRNFRTFEELEVYAAESRLGMIGMSPFGIDVVSTAPLRPNAKVRVAFGLPQADGSTHRIDVSTVVRRASSQGQHHVAYLRFSHLSDAQMDRITEYCAVVAGHRELRDTPGPEARLRSSGSLSGARVAASGDTGDSADETEVAETP